MGIIDLIQTTDEAADSLVTRVPAQGSGEFRLGSQVVVRESQRAVFFRDGKALDVFGPGRHTITTNNIPGLTGLIGAITGGTSMFTAEVYFVAMREFTNMKWGTAQPLTFRDRDFGMVRLRAFGTYSMRVADPQLFVGQFVGVRGAYSTADIDDYLKNVVVTEFNTLLGKAQTPLLDVPGLTAELAGSTRAALSDDFERVGLSLTTFQIGAITPPEEVQKAIDQRSAMGAIGDMSTFTQYQAAQALREAAQNPGGSGDLTGAGVGLGAGVALGGTLGQALRDAMAPQSGQAAQGGQPAADPIAQLQKLNELRQAGALTEEEFQAMKARIIGS